MTALPGLDRRESRAIARVFVPRRLPGTALEGVTGATMRTMLSGAPLHEGTVPPWFRQHFPGVTSVLEPQNRVQKFMQKYGMKPAGKK